MRRIIAGGAIVALALVQPVAAKAPADLQDLVNARAGQAEGQLEARGYQHVQSAQGEDRSWAYWWNGSKRQCAAITTREGRYADIRSTSAGDCNQKEKKGDGTAAAAVAIGAAALIGAIALSHKSHNHDDGAHYDSDQQEADYERGYRDGLYNQAYHNYARADAYSNGYQAGVRQRGHDTAYRPGYGGGGGYGGYVNVSDLVGRSNDDGLNMLSRRGFVRIDASGGGGDGHALTYWREASDQCVSVFTRGGTIRSIDAVRSRNCR